MPRKKAEHRPNARIHLLRYLDTIVEPTLDECKRNPLSVRLAFISCVVVYHSIDRVTKSTGNLKKTWGSASTEFRLVDLICHTLKHVEAGGADPTDRMPRRSSMPGAMGFNTDTLNESGPDVHQIYLLARAAAAFVRRQTEKL